MNYEEEAKDFLNEYEVHSRNYQEHLMEYIEGLIPEYHNEQYEEFMQLEDQPHIMRITLRDMQDFHCYTVEEFVRLAIFDNHWNNLSGIVYDLILEREEEE